MSASETVMGAQTGPTQGTGTRKSTSQVVSVGGQPLKTHSQP